MRHAARERSDTEGEQRHAFGSSSADARRKRLKWVGQCPGEECGWLFLDITRSGRRPWCDMADCGNLAKVRRFRERHRAST
jgi:predicted RNA-binding Zn ribbon-like protein